MIRYLIKNNFKLMARNWVNVFLLILCPLLVSTVLISAFSTLLAKYEKVDSFKAGFSIEQGSKWETAESVMIESADKAGIVLVKYQNADPEQTIRNEDLGGFVTISDTGYRIYRTEDEKVKGMTLEYFFSVFFEQAAAAPAGAASAAEIALSVEHPEFTKAVDSKDYYGIAFLLYFAWCGILVAWTLLSSEKKIGIGKRFIVSGLSETQVTFAKFIPTTLSVFLGIGIACILSSVLFGVHFGNALVIAGLLLAMIAAAIALGLAIHSLTDNILVTIISLFALVWVMGFFGGSFETYMFSSHSKTLKMLSPIYHCNRAVIEYSAAGSTKFIPSALLYCGGITVFCLLLCVGVNNLRRRGRA